MQSLKNYLKFLTTPFPYFFLFASLFVSSLYTTQADFTENLNKTNEEYSFVEDKDSAIEDADTSGFSVCYTNYGYSYSGAIFDSFRAIFTPLILPSYTVTKIFLELLKLDYPELYSHNLDTISKLSFFYFNLIFWVLLAYWVNSAHDNYLENKSPTNNLPGIFT